MSTEENKNMEQPTPNETSTEEQEQQIKAEKPKAEKPGQIKQFIMAAIIAGLLIVIVMLVKNGFHKEPKVMGDGSGIEKGSIELMLADDDNMEDGVSYKDYVNAKVAEGQFMIFINTDIKVDADNNANVLIQNVEQNNKSCKVQLCDSKDNVLFESDVLEPGYKIETAVLKNVKRGSHKGTAYFMLLDDSGKVVNKIGANVTYTKD